MEEIYCGTSGSNKKVETKKLSDIPIDQSVVCALIAFYGSDLALRPAQHEAIFSPQFDILNTRQNVILTTPTNSGKSLISYLLAIRDALKGKKVVIIEPLKALAQEKVEELREICELLKSNGGRNIKISITTGDYRLNDEFMGDKPAELEKKGTKYIGEIVVATPERLDAISRIKKFAGWFKDISLVCIDEAHLIGDNHRGATLELLITYLRSLEYSPQIVLLSATISNSEDLGNWLSPCTIIDNIPRYPELAKSIYHVTEQEDVNDVLVKEVIEVTKDQSASILIFVFRTDWAESLANKIAQSILGTNVGKDLNSNIHAGVAWYHSNMSASSKSLVKNKLMEGKVKVVVSTTALAMGINLPTSHVFIRDITFTGVKELDGSELMQMIGRAGRGDKNGIGVIFHRVTDAISKENLTEILSKDIYPKLTSRLSPVDEEGYFGRKKEDFYYLNRIGNQVLGILNRIGPISSKDFKEFLSLSWGGKTFLYKLDDILWNLTLWKLVYQDENTEMYDLTTLGKTAASCYLPPITAANIGQLLRDLIQDDPSGGHLDKLKPIDLFIVLCITSNEFKSIARYSKTLDGKIVNYMESLPMSEKSYLYSKWIKGEPEILLGSARVDKNLNDKEGHKFIYQNVYLAMLLYDLSKGINSRDLNSRYGIKLEDIEEKIRDSAMWLLAGIEKIFEVKNFYFHLMSNCEAEQKDIKNLNVIFKKISYMIFKLIPNLKYRSSLGELVRGIKRVYPNAKSYPSEGTISRLEGMGISDMKGLLSIKKDDLVKEGIKKEYVDLIMGYIQKRRS